MFCETKIFMNDPPSPPASHDKSIFIGFEMLADNKYSSVNISRCAYRPLLSSTSLVIWAFKSQGVQFSFLHILIECEIECSFAYPIV